MQNKNQKHCIQVLQVFDWINKPINIEIQKNLERKEFVKDEICGNIEIPCGSNTFIWKLKGELSVSGSVTICHETGCENMEVIINGKTIFILGKEEERTIKVNDLKSVEIRCKGNKNENCMGKYCLTLLYKLNKSCFSPGGSCKLVCFLSDECGNPKDSLECLEITQSTCRPNIKITLPNGKDLILQKVKILKKGFITIETIDKGKKCKICTLPFQILEDLILCAPLGTFVKCEINDFKCTVYFTDDCKILNIKITFCQQVQMVAPVNVELSANLCVPRFDIYTPSCTGRPIENIFK